jgi:protein-L-isoaspartate(D-aspartate) O-methyltransferase
MFDAAELATLRRAYARQALFLGQARDPVLEEAYAAVPREAYLGGGPWPIFRWPGVYLQTPDDDPSWLYADVLVGIDPERGLNNGQPSAHARWIAEAAPRSGDHVVHVGAGVGYYSAILAHMASAGGRLTAVEFDPLLAARAAANLAHLPNARVVHGDGSALAFEPADVIYVNAGAARPADVWLDALKPGGRLLLPLTAATNFAGRDLSRPAGAVFCITRTDDGFVARYVGPILVFPCEGMRDPASEAALARAFEAGGVDGVRRLRRDEAAPDVDCWVKGPGWSLTYR